MGNNLAQRAASAVTSKDNSGPTLAQLIEQMKPQIQRALPKHMDADKLARIALTVVRQTPKLAQCSAESFLGALLTSAQLGLEPGPLGESYLVPYGNVCTFIPGFRGLVKLAWQSGQLKNITAHVVHEQDDFDFAYGLEPFLRHKPARGSAGKVTEVYAAATMLNGGSAFVVMSIEDVDRIRKRSKTGNNGPWVTDWDAMARKTAVKQLIRWLPLSTELQTLNHAAELDGTTRTAVADLGDADVTYVDAEAVTEPETPAAGVDEPYDGEAEAAAIWQEENQ